MRVLILIVLCLGLACTQKEAPAPAETESTTAVTPDGGAADPAIPNPDAEAAKELPPELAGETPALDGGTAVTVTAAGEEPRTALRWDIAPGVAQATTLDVEFGIEAVVMVLSVKAAPYTVSFDLSLTPGKPTPGGETPVKVAVANAEFDPDLVSGKQKDQLKAAAVAAKTATGSYQTDARGQITGLSIEMKSKAVEKLRKVPGSHRIAHDMVDNLHWAIMQLTPSLPEEPVGLGAEWSAHRAIKQGDIIANELTHYRLEKNEGGKVELAVGVDQSAENQPLPALSDSATLELVSFVGEGSGTLVWNASQLLPPQANLEIAVVKGVVQKSADKKADVVARSTRGARVGASK